MVTGLNLSIALSTEKSLSAKKFDEPLFWNCIFAPTELNQRSLNVSNELYIFIMAAVVIVQYFYYWILTLMELPHEFGCVCPSVCLSACPSVCNSKYK